MWYSRFTHSGVAEREAMRSPELDTTAQEIVAPGLGILAADESEGTLGKRFAQHNVENTVENRRTWRETLFTTPGIEAHIGGVIFNTETLSQSTAHGTPFVELLENRGIIAGVKVDGGLDPHPISTREQLTKGRDDLKRKLFEVREQGAEFVKWRSVILIDELEDLPTAAIVDQNLSDQAYYAAASQKEGLVPIVEPEVLIGGNHSIETAKRIGERVIEDLFYRLEDHGVDSRDMLLKPSKIVPGAGSLSREFVTAEEVGRATEDCYEQTVPPDLPGIVFLSGGLSSLEATEFLNAINLMKSEDSPTAYSFSYGRALQNEALKAWAEGDDDLAQAYFKHRAKMNSLASQGLWTPEAEHEFSLSR